jgi:hypothetical protein
MDSGIIDWSKIIPAVISGIISIIVATILYFKTQNKAAIDALNKQLGDILKLAITYPYLDTKIFCDTWDRATVLNLSDEEEAERYQRYSVYCTLVFNYLASVAEHFDYSVEKIEKCHVNITAFSRQHKKYWISPLNDPDENTDSYDKRFVSLINQCLGR